MKKIIGLLFVLMMFVAMPAPAQVPTPQTSTFTAQNFSGILREDQGYVNAIFNLNRELTGTTLVFCNRVLDGGYCTSPQEFREQEVPLPSVNAGNLRWLSIPIVREGWDQRVSLYQIKGGSVERLAMLSLNPNDNFNLVVAAYEQQLPASNPFQTTSTVLKIIGGAFDPYQPATIFAGNEQIRLEPISPPFREGGNVSVRESVIKMDNSVLDRLPPTYPLTICQYGACQTVTVKHIQTQTGSGGGRG